MSVSVKRTLEGTAVGVPSGCSFLGGNGYTRLCIIGILFLINKLGRIVGVKGGKEGAARFMEALKLAKIVIHVADARTCVLHPATTTHRQLSDQQLIDAGIAPNMIRLSVGIEDPEDIIADLKQALEKV